ncbi:MAG: ral stress protein CsbD [Rhodocyclales bacterium]|nr:ral stress protein CsbD [Rhodocyclales bacterium]
MNKDQAKGSIKENAGKAQESIGKAIGSSRQENKGLEKQVEGGVQKTYGDAKESLKDSLKGR